MAKKQGKDISEMTTLADAPRLHSLLRKESPSMWIKMLETRKGADNGIDVRPYHKDKIYCVGTSLAKAFVKDMAVAVEVNEPTEEGKEPEEEKEKVIDWLTIDHKSVTRIQLVEAVKDVGMDEPSKDATKAEILALIQAKLKEEGMTLTTKVGDDEG